MEKFYGHCQQQDVSPAWIACLRSRHFGLFLCRCWEGEQTRHDVEQGYPTPTPGITVMPRNTPKANIVCWTTCGQAGAIVLGADPDPNIRAYLIRDASRYFGGGAGLRGGAAARWGGWAARRA